MSGSGEATIELPTGGGAVAGLGETFTPNLQTGTSAFTMPLPFPEGRPGLTPTLALTYSSGSPNGAFGLGWTLEPPSISRGTRSGVPRYGPSDRFVLTGHDDLVPVASLGSDPPGSRRYRPRSEQSFARILHHTTGDADFWTVRGRDGLRHTYGVEPASVATSGVPVTADPDRRDRIFSWHLAATTDPLGNRLEYEWVSHESPVGSAHRWTDTCLRQIRYGDYGDRADPGFLISVTFEYSAERPDVSSDRRAGFQRRTTRRCERIVIRTHPHDQPEGTITRVMRLEYTQAPGNGVSLLTAVRDAGVDGDRTERHPPLTFRYTGFDVAPRQWRTLDGAPAGLPALGAGTPDADLADVFGDGLPSVVQIGTAARYWRNLGNGAFADARPFRRAPAGVSLSAPDAVLGDFDGDGRPDLLIAAGGRAGYFPLDGNGGFTPEGLVRYEVAPDVALKDPHFRLVDLDGDGVSDGLRLDGAAVAYYSDRRHGWDRVERRALPQTGLDLADPRLRLADMTGDGLTDLVLVTDGRVDYWPSLGWCRWGPRVTMRGSPRSVDVDEAGERGFDDERLLLTDLDGDGCADVVYVGDRATTLWINRSGNGFGPPQRVRGTPPHAGTGAVRSVDLLGSGTAGVLWTSSGTARPDGRWRFLDLTGGAKPYLLAEVDNHRGATTNLEYSPSTRFSQADAEAGRPWRTSLPFPVQVVSRVTATELFSRTRHTSEYRYHDGYWDGEEREFRGFACVDEVDTRLTLTDEPPPPPASETALDPRMRTAGLDTGLGGVDATVLGNLVRNWDFRSPGAGPTRLVGASRPGASAAAAWSVWNNGTAATVTTTELVGTALPGAAGAMIRVTTDGAGCGLVQTFDVEDRGPSQVRASAWVFVRRGRILLGTGNGGHTEADVTSTRVGGWALLEAPNSISPANELVIYSADQDGADFDVACAWVREALPGTPAQHGPPSLKRSWFDLGPVAAHSGDWSELGHQSDYWTGDPTVLGPPITTAVPASLPPAARRSLARTARGKVLRTELYGLDGSSRQDRPFTVTEHTYLVRVVAGCEVDDPALPGGGVVGLCSAASSRTSEWERGDEPRTQATFLDDHDDYGQPRRELAVGVPRGRDPRRSEPAGTPYLALGTATRYAVRDDEEGFLCDRPCARTRYEVVNDGRHSLTELARLHATGAAGCRLLSLEHTWYDGPADTGLPLGSLSHGLRTRSEALTFTEGVLARAWGTAELPSYLRPPTAESGLLAEYTDLAETGGGEPVRFRRVERNIDVDWGVFTPDPALTPGAWSVTWSGSLTPTRSGRHMIGFQGPGGVLLEVDGTVLIDHPDDGTIDHRAAVDLTQDVPTSLVVRYRATGHPTSARLVWSAQDLPEQPVPSERLRPATVADGWDAALPAAFLEAARPLAGYVHRDAEPPQGVGWYTRLGWRYDVHDDVDPARPSGRGLVTATTDASGGVTSISHDVHALLPVRVVDPVGLEQTCTYDYRTLLPATVTDPTGVRERFRYTPSGMLSSRVRTGPDGSGDTDDQPGLRYEYGLTAYDDTAPSDPPQPVWVHSVQRVRHRSDLVAAEEADLGRPLTPAELVALFPEDEATVFPERFLQKREFSDGLGRLLQARTQADGTAIGDLGLTADPDGPPSTITITHRDVRTAVTVSGWHRLDDKGRTISLWEPFDDEGFAYRPPAAPRLAELRRSDTHYDVRGQPVRTVHPDGSEERLVRGRLTDRHRPEAAAASAWETWTYDVDDNGHRTHPLSSLSSACAWDTPAGAEVDALGRTTRTTRTLTTPEAGTSSRPLDTGTAYDLEGNVLAVRDPLARTATRAAYDLARRALSSETLDGGRTTLVLDPAGAALETHDARGATVLRSHDAAHRQVGVWTATVARPGFALTQVDEYGPAWLPDGDTTRGRVRRSYDEAGLVRIEAYDLNGRVVESTRQVLSTEALLSALPDPGGSWADAVRVVDWQPPAGGDREEHARALLDPHGHRTSSHYDALGRRTTLVCPQDVEGRRRRLDAAYATGGGLTRVTLDGSPCLERCVYDARGRQVLAVLGNGIATRYVYEAGTSRLSRLHRAPVSGIGSDSLTPAGPAVQDSSFGYDAAGNVLAVLERRPGCGVAPTPDRLDRRFTYDSLYRLLTADGREADLAAADPPWTTSPRGTDPTAVRGYRQSYELDDVGNLLSLHHQSEVPWTRTYDHRPGTDLLAGMTVAGSTWGYTYDTVGRLLDEGTSRHLTWDAQGRLASFRTQPQGAADPSLWAEYRYDPSGRRVLKLVRRQGGQVDVTTYVDDFFEHLVIDADAPVPSAHDLLHVIDAGQSRLALVRIGEPVPGDRTPGVTFPLGDPLWSSVVEVDEDGAVVSFEEYFPYGETSFGGRRHKRYRFTAKERDEESGFAYHVTRYYAPWLGRWTAPDPAGLVDGTNPFVYARSSPLVFTDPRGTSAALAMVPEAAPAAAEVAKPLLQLVVSNPAPLVESAAAVEGGVTAASVGTWAFIVAGTGLGLWAVGALAFGGTQPIDLMDRGLQRLGLNSHVGDIPGWVSGAYAKHETAAAPPPVALPTTNRLNDSYQRQLFWEAQWERVQRGCPELGLDRHPMEFAFSKQGKRLSDDTRAFDAGHLEASVFGGKTCYAVEARNLNRSTADERSGVNRPKQAIDICGVPVELWTAWRAVFLGQLDPKFLRDAPVSPGWCSGDSAAMVPPVHSAPGSK